MMPTRESGRFRRKVCPRATSSATNRTCARPTALTAADQSHGPKTGAQNGGVVLKGTVQAGEKDKAFRWKYSVSDPRFVLISSRHYCVPVLRYSFRKFSLLPSSCVKVAKCFCFRSHLTMVTI